MKPKVKRTEHKFALTSDALKSAPAADLSQSFFCRLEGTYPLLTTLKLLGLGQISRYRRCQVLRQTQAQSAAGS